MKTVSLALKSGQPLYAGINASTASENSGLGCRRRRRSWQRLELFARFETYSLSRRDANLLPGARVAANPGLSRLHVEHTEAPKLNTFPSAQRVLHGFEHSLHRLLGLGAGHLGFRHDSVNDVELDHAILQLDRAIPQGLITQSSSFNGNLC